MNDGERDRLLPGTPFGDDAASRRRRECRYGGLPPARQENAEQEVVGHGYREERLGLCPASSRPARLARVALVAISLVLATTVIVAKILPARTDQKKVQTVLSGGATPSLSGLRTTNVLLGEAASTGSSTGGSSSSGSSEQPLSVQPNVVFILMDDVGMNDIGYQSTDLGELTPFMDSLSAKGVRLGKYYTNHLCTPSRVSLFLLHTTVLCEQ